MKHVYKSMPTYTCHKWRKFIQQTILSRAKNVMFLVN